MDGILNSSSNFCLKSLNIEVIMTFGKCLLQTRVLKFKKQQQHQMGYFDMVVPYYVKVYASNKTFYTLC